jgi:hypothetical protein
LKAGYYEAESVNGQYTEIPVKVQTSDSAMQKKTFVALTAKSSQFVDKIEIEVSGAKYYRRSATLLQKRVSILTNGMRKGYYTPLYHFELTSGRTAIAELAHVRGQLFLIEIENHDNPPLTISSVKAFQLNRYLVAWLDADKQYTIRFGQPKLNTPVYDLSFFKDSIPERLVTLRPGEIKIQGPSKAASVEPFFSSKSIIWIAIILVMIVLGVMSLKLVRESSKAEGR